MNINDYLELTKERLPGHDFLTIRPRIVCADGFDVSIQASETHYCFPRNDYGPYMEVEIGYPSDEVPEWYKYAENKNKATLLDKIIIRLPIWIRRKLPMRHRYKSFYPTMTVYGYVPVEIVDAVLEQHGGIANGVG